MTAVLFGLASAVVYGTADFMGGLVSKRSGAYAVVLWSQIAGAVVLVAAVAVFERSTALPADLAWGALGGLGGGSGVVLLYRGLSVGRMSVVAPTTAVGAACIPVVVGLVLGERPPVHSLVGVLLALAAIVLVSSTRLADETDARTKGLPPGVAEAIGAGAAFALFFIALAHTTGGAGLWPLVAARVSILVAAAGAVATRSTLRPAEGTALPIAVLGVLDMAANLLYLLAARRGLLSIVAVLVSLYPAATVLLARVVLRERMTGAQLAGLVVAGVGVGLIAWS